MTRKITTIGALAAAALSMAGTHATAETKRQAQVLDATYRGTMVCAKLPFTEFAMREAVAVTLTGGAGTYTHVVRLRESPEPAEEKGAAKMDGARIVLDGSWKGDAGQYQANYSGSFVRRSAKLIGTQTWTVGGRIVTRSCSGVIKRPLKAFLPRNKKPASQ
jgi:hypothetical protein